MLKVYIETLEPAELKSRLEMLLQEGGVTIPVNRYLAEQRPQTGARRFLRRWGWLRGLHKEFSTWRRTGWSLRWIGRRVPVVGPLVWKVYGVITQRSFRLQVLAELARLGDSLQRVQREVSKLDATVVGTLTPVTADMQSEQTQLREQVAIAFVRLRAIEQCLASPSPAALMSSGSLPDVSLFPSWYLALEASLRGDMSDIEARLERYLPYLDCGQVGKPGWPVLDLGCGRGEWLKLLGKRGLVARGVDTNPAMLDEARRQGLDVSSLDLIAALRSAEACSIGAITAFQVVEHLDANTLLELFHQAMRVLRPGGVLLLETPNPENLQVGAYSFWLDPTHVRPIPPPLLAHSASYFGFIDITIVRSNPWREDLCFDAEGEAARHLEKLMFSAQDYALVARKPYAKTAAPALAKY
jgi:O-antigen chain-terminating methyltransferase